MDDSDEDQDYVGEDEDESESSDDGVSAAKITNRPQVGLVVIYSQKQPRNSHKRALGGRPIK